MESTLAPVTFPARSLGRGSPMSLDHHVALPPPVSDAWEALADGLSIQRIHLHQAEIRAATQLSPRECLLPEQATPAALITRPLPTPEVALPLVEAAGLLAWVTLPQQLGAAQTGSRSILEPAGADVCDILLQGSGDPSVVHAG